MLNVVSWLVVGWLVVVVVGIIHDYSLGRIFPHPGSKPGKKKSHVFSTQKQKLRDSGIHRKFAPRVSASQIMTSSCHG